MGQAVATILLMLALVDGSAAQPSLTPGAHFSDCRSALLVGVPSCRRSDSTPAADATAPVTEAQIDAFLQQYGKPPRQAVRALLDPSDENIAAWLRAERRIISVAGYVAQRMTELQSRLDSDAQTPEGIAEPAAAAAQHQAAMMQMRATLYTQGDGEDARAAARSLQQVLARYPMLEARLARPARPSTPYPARQPDGTPNLDTMLPVSVVAEDSADSSHLPWLLLEDLRQPRAIFRIGELAVQRVHVHRQAPLSPKVVPDVLVSRHGVIWLYTEPFG